MIQCKECEFCEIGANGHKTFKCDPFSNIKEAECVAKWQLIRLDMLVATYQGMLKFQRKMEPLQEKIFKYMQREINDIDESENWKIEDEDERKRLRKIIDELKVPREAGLIIRTAAQLATKRELQNDVAYL